MDNYFELYHLPNTYQIDKTLLRTKFLEVARMSHPDYAHGNDEASKDAAIRMAAINNIAYKTLNDDNTRLEHLMIVKEIVHPDEKHTLSPNFLMGMMDINEAVSEYEAMPNENSKEEIHKLLESENEIWENEVNPLLISLDNNTISDADKLRLKECFFRKKYLLRIQNRLTTFAAHSSPE